METRDNVAAADRLAALRETLAEAVLARLPAPGARFAGDLRGHLDALTAALRRGGAEELAEYAAWTAVLVEALGAPRADLDLALTTLGDVIAERLPAQLRGGALDLLGHARERLAQRPVVTPGELARVPPLAGPPYESAAAALEREAARIASLTVALAYRGRPHDAIKDGPARIRALEDTGLHLGQLVEAVRSNEPALFGEYVVWTQILLAQYGLAPPEVAGCFRALGDAVGLALPEPLAATPRRFIEEALDRLQGGAPEVPSFIDPGAPLGALARGYLDALHAGDRRRAGSLVLEAAEAGTPVRDLYVRVLQPCQYELGRLWQRREISVAEEHYCTAVTQLVMSQLQPFVLNPARVGRLVVATSALGNLHEVGIRFVADFFEMAGWDTLYLGASAPPEHVVREVIRWRAQVLAISATLADHLAGARALITALRAEPAGAQVRVLVGGHPFRVVHDLWKRIGADGSAADGEGAVAQAERLLAAAPDR